MSDLPDGWEWTTLDEIAETTLGKMLDRGKSSGHDPVPYLRNFNVQWGRFDLSDISTMEIPPQQLATFELRRGDLMVCEGGEIGRCAVWPGTPEYIAFQKALHRVRPHPGVEAKYLAYLLEHLANTKLLQKYATGSTIKHLPQQQLRKIPVPLPPPGEQQRIVSELESLLSRLDSANLLLQKNLATIASFRSSLASQAVQGTLIDTEATADTGIALYEKISKLRAALTSKRRRVPAQMALIDHQELPIGWKLASLDSLCWDIQYGTSAKATSQITESSIPVVRMGNIQDGKLTAAGLKYLPLDSPDIQALILDDGDLLFNRTNSAELVGKSAVYSSSFGPATFASYLIRCRLLPGVNPNWVCTVINSPIGRRYISSVASQQVGQANVNGSKLAAMPIPLPSEREQRQILEQLNKQHDTSDRLNSGALKAISHSQSLRRSLIREALRGNLVPQDPSEEPASRILDHIKSEHPSHTVNHQRRASRKAPKVESSQEKLL